jgi:hypothetical protein
MVLKGTIKVAAEMAVMTVVIKTDLHTIATKGKEALTDSGTTATQEEITIPANPVRPRAMKEKTTD